MALSEEHFKRRFTRLEGYFLKTVKRDHIEEWWEACRNWDYAAFDKTMSALEREDYFPTFPRMREMYDKFKPLAERENQRGKRYCGNCIDGYIHFWSNERDDRSYVAWCQECLKLNGEYKPEFDNGHRLTMNPLDPRIDWIHDPEEHNNARQIRLSPEMIREMANKMFGGVPHSDVDTYEEPKKKDEFEGYDEIPF